MLRFDERPFSNTLMDLKPYWDYEPTSVLHADRPRVYTSEKILNLSTKKRVHLKCSVFDGSREDGLEQPKLHSFILDEPHCYKVFSEPETIH